MTLGNGYGIHPTIYGNLSDIELVSLYRESSWFNMGEDFRQQLLQETVNRSAAAKGELGACEVRFTDLDSSILGRQSGNVIDVNRTVFAQDLYIHIFNGHIIEEKVADSNMLALETVLHEDIHAWQSQCMDGTIQCIDAHLLSEYKSNSFTSSFVPDGNGGKQLGSHYLNGITQITGYYMYYFQSTERDAHLYSEQQAVQAANKLQQMYGSDRSLTTYQKNVLLNGYQATYRSGKAIFDNNNFDKEINQVLSNQFYGTNIAVDQKIQATVQKEMAESYQAQIQSLPENKEGISIDKNYTPVTIEDYDRGMRSTVNAFYEHAMNDPFMSSEEAIAETSQVAENYLNEMEELQEAYENDEIMSENDTATGAEELAVDAVDTSVDASVGADDGVGDDGIGDDGGIE